MYIITYLNTNLVAQCISNLIIIKNFLQGIFKINQILTLVGSFSIALQYVKIKSMNSDTLLKSHLRYPSVEISRVK